MRQSYPRDVLLLVFLPLLLYWESVTTALRAIRRDLRGRRSRPVPK
ncbi:hypothetical protein ACWD4J_11950 [Streptomyces sp. NPDC002577]